MFGAEAPLALSLAGLTVNKFPSALQSSPPAYGSNITYGDKQKKQVANGMYYKNNRALHAANGKSVRMVF